MGVRRLLFVIVLIVSSCAARAENPVLKNRRERAAAAFHDGILLLHANSAIDFAADGFRQDPFFYYFTGLENTAGAVLAIDGKSGESWLFLPSVPSLFGGVVRREVQPGPEAVERLGVEHVVEWAELEPFLASHAGQGGSLYYANDPATFAQLPPDLLNSKSPEAPIWVQVILQRWPAFQPKEIGSRIQALMAVQSPDEVAALRLAAKTTVSALMSGMRAIRPGVSQRSVEAVVEDTCWKAGAHGSSFWPWVMSGKNGVFPNPGASLIRYDHLDQTMGSGDLVRLDVGCEWDHYQGDLGRTVPVSGHYDKDERETWNIFVAAYHAGAKALRDGITVDEVFDAWRAELLRHRPSAKSLLAQHAIELWSDRKNVPYWQVHTTNLSAGLPVGPLREGTTINFEPIASIDGQGYFLEDMYHITKDGAELLTPGVPYTADEIEKAMH